MSGLKVKSIIVTHRIDKDGFYIEPVLINSDEYVPEDCITGEVPSYYKARWNGSEWVEGATESEIDDILGSNRPMTEIERLEEQNKMLAMSLMELANIVLSRGGD